MRHRVVAAILAGVFVGLLGACGGPDAEQANPADAVTPYTTTCARTTCEREVQRCRDYNDEQRSDCYDMCVYASDPVGCASVCRSIGSSSSCICSTKDDSCAEYAVDFSPPPLNAAIYEGVLAFISSCAPDFELPEAAATYRARSYRHEYLDVLACYRERGCDAYDECDHLSRPGSIGDAICARQRACGSDCLAGTDDALIVDGINGEEGYLRPALVAELERCSQEPDCKVATACWKALQPALALGKYPDP